MDEARDRKPPLPLWIDKEFVQNSLNEGGYYNNVRVENVTVRPPGEDGQGYSSVIHRIVATVVEGRDSPPAEIRLVLKSAHEQGRLKEVGETVGAFQRESLLLRELLPAAHRLLEAVEGGASQPLSACCHAAGGSPVNFLLLEDLSAAGMRLVGAGRLLDRPHCELVLRAYARLHAASVAVFKRSPQYRARVEALRGDSEMMRQLYKGITGSVFRVIARQLSTMPGYERFAAKYENTSDRYVDEMFQYWKSQVALPVLLHGDCWKNNFMFRYEGDAVKEVRILDFQISRVHSPAYDLQYLLHSNARADVLQHHVGALLAQYHGALQSGLRALGLEEEAGAFPLETLHAELDRAGAHCVISSALTGMMVSSEQFGGDFAKFFEDTDATCGALEQACRHPDAVARLQVLLPEYERRGYFLS